MTTTTYVRASAESRPRATSASARLRSARAELIELIREGAYDPADVIADPPGCVAGLRSLDFLQQLYHCRSHGKTAMRRFNARAMFASPPVNLLVPLGELTERQRSWLLENLQHALPADLGRRLSAAA